MENLPLSISIIFIVTTFIAILLFYKATKYSKTFLVIIITWLIGQTFLSLGGFYHATNGVPPRFIILIFPPIFMIIFLLLTNTGKRFIDGLDLRTLTIFHSVRIPVELVLLSLYFYKLVPKIMTFEGTNFDIFSGLTALIVFYFMFKKKFFHRRILIIWNIICFGLLVNIVVSAILSAPFDFQRFAFDQPNIAVLYFPFVWLPACIVPLVGLAHVSAIRQLMKNRKREAINILSSAA